jgi:ABC-2 type transport system ATP-binding protein
MTDDDIAEDVVVIEGLTKHFGATAALDGLDLKVPAGIVFGLLGPNGCGKTTTVRVLSTLTVPDSGRALVAGFDVVRQPAEVRRRIGLVGQHAALDERLPGRLNLVMLGRLWHLGEKGARKRADELLERFDLSAAANRLVSTYSGGMRRRLDLAASLIVSPRLLLLDEPSTGLDPRGRNEVWESIRELTAAGTSVLLTTQYLDEADHLAQRVAVIDAGRVIAEGTPDQLKREVGTDHLEVVLRDPADLQAASSALGQAVHQSPYIDTARRQVSVPITDGFPALAAAVAELEHAHLKVEDVTLRRSTLDDVFLRLTGHQSVLDSDLEVVA